MDCATAPWIDLSDIAPVVLAGAPNDILVQFRCATVKLCAIICSVL